ncbi:MAG: S41 family peptidase [Clostridia bacterium]
MKKTWKVLSLLLIASVLFSSVLSASVIRVDEGYLNQLYDFISSMYNEDIDRESVLGSSFNGLFTGTSPYSCFESVSLREEGTHGIGAALEKVRQGFMVSAVHPGSNAYNAGLKSGDIIFNANRKSLALMNVKDFNHYLAGEARGIQLDVLDPGTGETRTLLLDAENIQYGAVEFFIHQETGFIRIHHYGPKTGETVSRALSIFSASRVRNVILDLRDSISMNVEAAAAVADLLLPYGRIAQVRDKAFHASFKQVSFTFHLAVNGNTAGAGEIIARAVEDKGTGMVYGSPTAGNSLYVKTYPVLSDDAYMKYAVQAGRTDIPGIMNHIRLNGIVPGPFETTGYLHMVESHVKDARGLEISRANNIIPGIATREDAVAYLDADNRNRIWIRKDYEPGELSYDVFLAKKILSEAGYFKGELNVSYDANAVGAVNAFKKDMGLEQNGILDKDTQKLLNFTMLAPKIFADPCILEILEYIKGE